MVTIEDSDELVGNGNAEKIWNYLLSHGITPAGAAGILGNMANESSTNLDPTLLEERAVRRTRITGQMYTQMVDSGEISRAEVISSSRFVPVEDMDMELSSLQIQQLRNICAVIQ